jgi:two-component system nitrogen regulation response regulator NtrX
VVVDCAEDSREGLERRLFGMTERPRSGARPVSAQLTNDSAVAQANLGTLVLRNVAEAPESVQARLARLLRDGEAMVAELTARIAIDVRPIAIVDPAIDAAVEDGRLRRDLFERLSRVRIDVPPLRCRREDLPPLAIHLLTEACRLQGVAVKSFSRSALKLLTMLPWKGNAGELKALIHGMVRAVPGQVIDLDDVLERANLEGAARLDVGLSLRDAKAQFERECIATVLMKHQGRVGEAARALGIQRTNLYRKVRQLRLDSRAVRGR